MIRPAGTQDLPFLRDMLRHAYYARWGTEADVPLERYVAGWGRPGDRALVAIDEFQPVGAAWYRLFPADEPGYGFVDEQTPELTIAIMALQADLGVQQTGVMDVATIQAIYQRGISTGVASTTTRVTLSASSSVPSCPDSRSFPSAAEVTRSSLSRTRSTAARTSRPTASTSALPDFSVAAPALRRADVAAVA